MSPLISWNSTLELGIPSVDLQHQELAELLNKLADCTHDASTVLALLDELYTHTREHFHHEEAMMEEIAFGELHMHHNEHLLLLAELKSFLSHIRDGDTKLEQQSLCALKDWLVVHIKSSDRSFAESYHRVKINTA